MWEEGVCRAVESNGGKMGTTVIEQQLKKKKKNKISTLTEATSRTVPNLFLVFMYSIHHHLP